MTYPYKTKINVDVNKVDEMPFCEDTLYVIPQ